MSARIMNETLTKLVDLEHPIMTFTDRIIGEIEVIVEEEFYLKYHAIFQLAGFEEVR